MLGRVGVEKGLRSIHRYLPQQPGAGELVQCVVDRRKRNWNLGLECLFIKHLGSDMPIALAEQHETECQTLASRADAPYRLGIVSNKAAARLPSVAHGAGARVGLRMRGELAVEFAEQ
jgi:hypothetical protein